MRFLLLVLVVVAALVPFAGPEPAGAGGALQIVGPGYYVGEWEWDADADTGGPIWRSPYESTVALYNLMARPAITAGLIDGQRRCCALYFLTGPEIDPTLLRLGGSGADTVPPEIAAAARFLLRLGRPLAASTVEGVIYELLTAHGDPTWEARWKPVTAGSGRKLLLQFGGLGWQRYAGDGSVEWAQTLAVRRLDYAEWRRATLAGELPPGTYRKALANLASQYGVDYREFLGGLPDEGTVKPATVLPEDWDCADSDSLNCDLSWTETGGDIDIVANEASSKDLADQEYARTTSSLSSDDHYVEGLVLVQVSSTPFGGVICRFASATDTFYIGEVRDNATTTYRITQVVAGVRVTLGSANATAPGDGPHTVRLTCDDAAANKQVLNVGGVDRVSTNDATITGNLQTGIGSAGVNGADRVSWQSWTAVDIAAAVRRITVTVSD